MNKKTAKKADGSSPEDKPSPFLHPLCCLYEETGKQEYLDVCREWGSAALCHAAKCAGSSRAVLSQIDAEGMVQGVSYGTVVSDCLDDYRRVALRPTGYGQNLTLLMMTELMCWPEGSAFKR